MKKTIITKAFLILFISLFLSIPIIINATEFIPQVTIPGAEDNFTAKQKYIVSDGTKPIAEYIQAIYNYMLSIVGITAAIALMIGGVIWLTAGGSSEKVSQAKSWIMSSLTGLVLALTSYLILQTINPQLVSFTPTEIQKIQPLVNGCCHYTEKNINIAFNTTSLECYYELFRKGLTPKIINQNAKIEDQISNYFDTKKRANYTTQKCEVVGYCIVSSVPLNTIWREMREKTVVASLPENACLSLRYDKQFIKEEDFQTENNQQWRDVYKKTCEDREGKSCRNSDGITCYCINGFAYFEKGKQDEPCGNDGGVCVPTGDMKTDGKKICPNRDWGGRSCGNGLKCCEKKALHPDYYPGMKL